MPARRRAAEVSSAAPDTLAPAVAALGGIGFASALVAALNRAVPVDHVCLMRFAGRSGPPVLESASWRGGQAVGAVQQAYLAGMYRLDPVAQAPLVAGHSVHLLDRSAIPDAAYRGVWQGRAGLLQRWSVLTAVAGERVALHLYRLQASGALSAAERDWLAAWAPLLGALAAKHVEIVGVQLRSRDRADRLEALDARLHAVCGALTRRERAVLARVLLGITSQGIALDLGIGLASVLTYRKRAYARLGVSSQSELFALCW